MPKFSETFRMNNGSFVHILGEVSERVASKYMQEVVEPRLHEVHAALLSHLPSHYNGCRWLSPSDRRKKVLFPKEVLETGNHFVYGPYMAMEQKKFEQPDREQSAGSAPWDPTMSNT